LKKLTILIYSLAGGGAERVVSILLNELKDKFDITLVLMNETISYTLPNNIKIIYLEKSFAKENALYKFLKLPFLAYKYKLICQKNNITTSMSFMNRPNYINIFSKLFGNKIKTIISERIAPSQEYKTDSTKDKISRLLIKYLYPKADLIIPNAQEMADDLILNFNIPNDKIKVINNPVDIKMINKLKNEIVDYDFTGFNFINVARFHKQKNHKLLINSFSKLENKNTNLLLLGDGHLNDELKEQIKELKLENRVKFFGFNNNPYKYIVKSDCFVFSSNYEGFPNVLVEALSCEIPVISTDCISGPSEILNDTNRSYSKNNDDINICDYGILTPVNNEELLVKSMKIILEDKILKEKFVNSGYKRAVMFDKDIIVDEFVRILN